MDSGSMDREAGPAPATLLPAHACRRRGARQSANRVAGMPPGNQPDCRGPTRLTTMPNWKAAIDDRLRELPLAPARYLEIAEELSQHLQDRYDELRAAGATEAEAASATMAELNGAGAQMAAELTRLERAP